MNNLAKGAIGVTSTGTACTGGYFVCKEYVFTSSAKDSSAPQKIWKAITPSATNYAEETLGKIYGGNLLDPFDEANREKWDELYQKILDDDAEDTNPPRIKKIADGAFQSLAIKYSFAEESSATTTSLNKECKRHYEKEIEGKDETNNSKIQIGSDKWNAVWMLCSAWDPKVLGSNLEGYPNSSIAKTHEKELLSTKNSDNEGLWQKKNREFFSLANAPTEKIFKELYEANKGGENQTTLREKCEETYSLVPGSQQGEKPTGEEVIKYCSLKIISA